MLSSIGYAQEFRKYNTAIDDKTIQFDLKKTDVIKTQILDEFEEVVRPDEFLSSGGNIGYDLPVIRGGKAMWDVVLSFRGAEYGNPAICTDGKNLYTANFQNPPAGSYFTRYNMDGTNPVNFTISGVNNTCNITYDGNNFYAVNGSAMNIYKVDLENETLIEGFAAQCTNLSIVRAIAYDATLDSGNGGFWVADWYNVGAISKTGAQLVAGIDLNWNTPAGIAFDPYSDPENPCLWLSLTSGGPILRKFDIKTLTLTTEIYNCGNDNLIHLGQGNAQGVYAYNNGAGKYLLALNISGTNASLPPPTSYNYIVIYEIADVVIPIVAPAPVSNLTATPNVSGAFNSLIEWTNPALDENGVTLNELTAVKIYQNGTLIHTVTDPVIGTNETYTANVTQGGRYFYKLVAENSVGTSEPAETEGRVGLWNYSYSFRGDQYGNPAICTDGKNLYTANFQAPPTGSYFTRYNMDGTNPVNFTIDGVTTTCNLTYDGEYFYAVNGVAMNIYKVDLEHETLVSAFSAQCFGLDNVRTIAYDFTLDNGNGGFWVADWYNVGAISKTGVQLVTGVNLGWNTPAGIAFDSYSDPENPCLWLSLTSGGPIMRKFDIKTLTLTTEIYNCGNDNLIHLGQGNAQGAYAYNNGAGKYLLALNIAGTNTSLPFPTSYNYIVIYEIADIISVHVAPAPISNLTVTPNASGAFNSVIEWTNPTLDENGVTLSELTAVKIYQNGTLIHTVTDPVIGANETYIANVTQGGRYFYKLISENSVGASEPAEADSRVGLWNYSYSFKGYQYANSTICTDGKNFYSANFWAPNAGGSYFIRYNMDGSNPETFTISGVETTSNLTYDGEYFYAVNGVAMNIYKVDLKNETLVSAFSAQCFGLSNVRAIAYDPTLDNGNGGFWVADWYNVGAISKTGAQLVAGIDLNWNSPASITFDPYSYPDNPCLWLSLTSGGPGLRKFDIKTHTLTPEIYNCGNDNLIHLGQGSAQGTFAWDNGAGKYMLALNIAGTNASLPPPTTYNYIIVYEIAHLEMPDPPVITTSSLPNGEVDLTYNQTLAATSDTSVTWSLESSNLPDGLTLSDSGLISGIPTVSGTSLFAVKATNAGGSVTKALQIVIQPKYFDSGSGVADDPYIITTPAQLAQLATLVNIGDPYFNAIGKWYKLGNDIDLSGYSTGEGWTPIGNLSIFQGNFEGNNKKVTNMVINMPSAGNGTNFGLFGSIRYGTIKNLGVENIDITIGSSSINVGGVLGYAYDQYVNVINCYTTGKIVANASSNSYAGGVVGNCPGSISNCYSTVSVTATGEASANAGGVLGFTGMGITGAISNCYATGAIKTTSPQTASSGGVVGISLFSSAITNCVGLNPSIDCTGGYQYFGRVVGNGNTGTNHIGFNEMINPEGGITWNNVGANLRDGADIDKEKINTDCTLGGMFSETNGWAIETGKLPGLFGEPVNMPLHLLIEYFYSISGKVTGNDAPDGIEGVKVILSGDEIHTTFTDESGDYSFENVDGDFVYDIEAIKSGYISYHSTVKVTEYETVYNISLVEYPSPVVNPVAVDNETNVTISWEEPIVVGKNNSNSVINYRVYRLLDGNQSNETTWTALTVNVTGLSYNDNGWNTVEEGIYCWAVKAEYTDEMISIPQFTNKLIKGMRYPFTVNLTTISGDPVIGALVRLTNLDDDPTHDYTITATDDAVNFDEVWKGTYEISVKLKGFHPHIETNIVIDRAGLSYEAPLIEIIKPATNPFAEESDENVIITWNVPDWLPYFNNWIKHCVNDEVAGQMGWSESAGNDMTAVMRFLPDDFTSLGIVAGHTITKLSLGMGTHLNRINTFEIRIWEGGTSVTNPGELVYIQPVTIFNNFTQNALNEVILTTPFVIDPTKELRIGYRIVNSAGYPIGRDAGPYIKSKGDILYCEDLGGWLECHEKLATQQWNYNFSIKAYVTSENDNKLLEPVIETPKSLLSYSIYRLTQGQPESAWTLLSDEILELTYTDTDWSMQPEGIYQWAIKANYYSYQSSAVLTNPIGKVGIEEVGITSFKLRIYPNPTKGELTIQWGIDNRELTMKNYELRDDKIEIYDVFGRKLNNYQWSNKNCQIKIDVSSLPVGIYMIKIINDKNISTQLFVKE